MEVWIFEREVVNMKTNNDQYGLSIKYCCLFAG